jgi:hypothetical protein
VTGDDGHMGHLIWMLIVIICVPAMAISLVVAGCVIILRAWCWLLALPFRIFRS